jgi:ABC-2 type transport system permease protein
MIKIHRIKAMLLNYYYLSINSLDRIFDIVYWPLLDIFIWGFMTHFIQGISDFNILNVILGGIVLWVFLWRSTQDLVVYLLDSYWSRSIFHLFITPLKSAEFVISLAIIGLIRSFLAFTTMSILAYFLYDFTILQFNLFHIAMLIGILVLFAWALGILISSFIFLWGTRIQVLAWSVIWIIQPFSCVFYPLSALPNWAAKIAIFLPTTQVFENLRATINGSPLNYGSLLYSLIFILIFFVLASLFLSYSVKRARNKGHFSKPE